MGDFKGYCGIKGKMRWGKDEDQKRGREGGERRMKGGGGKVGVREGRECCARGYGGEGRYEGRGWE
jgi:hypothetical protein